MGILKVIFLAFLVIFPLAEVGRIQFSNGIAISLNDIFLFLTITSWLLYKFISKSKFKKPILFKEIVIFCVIALMSLLLNIHKLNAESAVISFMYLVRWIAYALIYFIIFDFDAKFKQLIIKAMYSSGFLIVVSGYIQYFLYPNLKNLYYLGWDDHLYRMFSTFLDPNFAGAFFVIYFLFSLYFLTKYFKNKTDYKISFALLVSALSFGAIYLTYSRSAFIMLVVGLLSYLWLKGKRKILVAVFVILIALLFVAPKSFKLEGTNFLRIVSAQGRIESMQQGAIMFLQNPIFGVGFNSYRYALNRDFEFNNSIWKTTHAGAGNDNSYIFILATTGLIGFASFLMILYKMLTYPIKQSKSEYSTIIFPIILALLVNCLFINSMFYVLILEWIWILLALTESS